MIIPDKIKNWIKLLNCPMCFNNSWLLMSETWHLENRANSIPLIAMMCDDCGYMVFFNAIKIGVVDKDS